HEVTDGARGQHAAGNACSRRHGRAKETAAGRRGRLLLRRTLRPWPTLILVIGGRRGGARADDGYAAGARLSRRPAAAEQTAEEAARLRSPRLPCALKAAHLLLEILDAVAGLLQRMLLHQHGLHQHVGCVRRAPNRVVDDRLGLSVLFWRAV